MLWLYGVIHSVNPLSPPPFQALIGTDSITNLHKLEQVSSDEGIGTLAENLLEALREHAHVNLKIDAARRETRAEKKRMAMAMRQKALGTLGMTVRSPPTPPPAIVVPSVFREDEVDEDDDDDDDDDVVVVCSCLHSDVLCFRPTRRVRW